MGEAFEKLKWLWEWSRFYPPPAKYFFALTFLFVVASAAIFLIFHGRAAQAKAVSELADAIPISIDADVSVPTIQVPEENGVPDDRALRYQVQDDGGVCITPVLPYLDKWNQHQEVEALNAKATQFRWRYPKLDLRFTNNTDKPLILNSIMVEVAESMPEDNPVVFVMNDYDSQMSFKVVSPIPQELSECSVEYNVVGVVGTATSRPTSFAKTLTSLGGVNDVPVDDALASAGAVPAELRDDPLGAYKRFFTGVAVPQLGPFTKGTASIRGQLLVKRGGSVLGPFRFVADVALVPPGPQVLLPPSATYDAMLREYGRNYTAEIRTANTIAPSGAERIEITLAAPRSSYHEFRLRLKFHDGRERVSDLIKLHLLRPGL